MSMTIAVEYFILHMCIPYMYIDNHQTELDLIKTSPTISDIDSLYGMMMVIKI